MNVTSKLSDTIEGHIEIEENNQAVSEDVYYRYLMHINKHRTLRVAVICFENVALTTIFAYVANAFDKWWIVLFSLLCMSTYKFDNK